MKHTALATVFLITVFTITQLVGLGLVGVSIEEVVVLESGETVVSYSDTAIGPRPETEGVGSLIYILSAVLIGTVLILLIVRYKKLNLWKAWFFLAVFISVAIALGVLLNLYLALVLALVIAYLKIWRTGVFVHNFSEILMYSGLAVFLVPLFNVFWAVILLLIISVYDMYAVWKSKHMVSMAKFMTGGKVFAGLMLPYERREKVLKVASGGKKPVVETREAKLAVLGGGDVAFPLIFSGVVMQWLVTQGFSKTQAFSYSLATTLGAVLAVSLLFFLAKKDRFYPAMPFITAGCLFGWAVLLVVL